MGVGGVGSSLSSAIIFHVPFNKHSMTGPTGNSEFCAEGKQNSLFPVGPVTKCFVILPNSK